MHDESGANGLFSCIKIACEAIICLCSVVDKEANDTTALLKEGREQISLIQHLENRADEE